jgi:2-keto-4-pentenoate hydratase
VQLDAIERAATLIRIARLGHVPLDVLPAPCRPSDESEAYDVQEALNRQLTADGQGPLAGYKIGCTSPVMQAFLNIGNPCAGAVFGRTVKRGYGRFRASDFLHVGVECEIAVELSADLDGRGKVNRDRLGEAVGAVMASIEIVDDRYRDYTSLGTPTLIADDFFNAGCVLGEPVVDWQRLDLAGVAGRMLINEAEVGVGHGADILGHPLEALAWLAASMSARGRSLLAGEFVSLGSVVATKWVKPGDEVRIELEGLGAARATFL